MHENKLDNYLLEEDKIDFKYYINLIFSKWYWFLISLSIAYITNYLVNRYSSEVYTASCTLIIADDKTSEGIESVLDELTRVQYRRRKAVVDNEISILKSYLLNEVALQELNFDITYINVGKRGIAETELYKNSPIKVVLDTNSTNLTNHPVYINILSENEYKITINDDFEIEKVMKFGEPFRHSKFNFTIYLTEYYHQDLPNENSMRYYFYLNNKNSLINRYRNSLTITTNTEKGSILKLSITGEEKNKIVDYLNKLSEVYIRTNLENKNLTSYNTLKFIDEQLKEIIDSLETAGMNLQEFRSKNNLIDLTKEGNLLLDQLESLKTEKTKLEVNQRYYEYLRDYINNKNDFSEVVAPSVIGIQDALLNSLVSKLNELYLQKKTLSFNIHKNAPQIIQLNEQIIDTKNALSENILNLVRSNKLALENLHSRSLKIDSEVKKIPGTERHLLNIERKFSINNEIYTFLLEKRAEAGINMASNTSDHKILDIARVDNTRQIKPNKQKNKIVALSIGLIVPFILLLLINYFNNKISSINTVEQILKAPVLANIGHNELFSEYPIQENPKSAIAEAFRGLRTNLSFMLNNDAQVIAITSAESGEGKTFCSVNLAGILSILNKKTLLISLDLRRPKIHKVFNIPNHIGISTYLANKNNFNEVLQNVQINNLSVVTSGPIPPNPAELIASENMANFIDEAKQKFNYIILDTPPIGIVTDTLNLTSYINAFLFVIRLNYSHQRSLDLINSIYSDKITPNIGVVINDIISKRYGTYSYKNGYNYSYNYSSDYYTENTETAPSNYFTKLKKHLQRLIR